MTSEIINIQVGNCGNMIGNSFLSQILQEHWLDKDGLFSLKYNKNNTINWLKDDPKQIEMRQSKINSYFREINTELFYGYIRHEIELKYTKFIPNDIQNLIKYYLLHYSNQRYIPRTILIDLDPNTLDIIRTSNIGNLYNAGNYVMGNSSTGNNWAKGHYTYGAELIDTIMDNIRNEAEKCNCIQGFQLCHSLGGGTGSGLGTLILLKIRDMYPDRMNTTFSVYPSPKSYPETYIAPYNATLSIHQLLELSDITFMIDMEALYNISHNVLRLNEPKYSDLNWITSLAMSGITSTLRLGASNNLNATLRKFGMNMVTFPRLHFLLTTQAALCLPGVYTKNINLSVQEVADQMWSSRNCLCNVDPGDGKYLNISAIYRGCCDEQEVDDENCKVGSLMADNFVTWIPNMRKSTIIEVALNNLLRSGTFVANTTSVKEVYQRISAQFIRSYKRKAFLHWYKGEGMDEMEFQEADKNLRDLITEYQDKQDAVICDDNDYETDDDLTDDDYDLSDDD